MIDWYNLFANALWILALALALAALGCARWVASLEGEKLKTVLKRAVWQNALNLAGMIFCAGLALTTQVWWEQLLWAVLGVSFALQIALLRFSSRKTD